MNLLNQGMMTKEDILEGEKLIASYMGYVYYPHNQEEASKGLLFGWMKPEQRKPNLIPKHRPVLARKHSDLKFSKSWDWLMPVLEKMAIGKGGNIFTVLEELIGWELSNKMDLFEAIVDKLKLVKEILERKNNE